MRKTTVFLLIAAIFIALLSFGCRRGEDVIIDVDPINTDLPAASADPETQNPGDGTSTPGGNSDAPAIETGGPASLPPASELPTPAGGETEGPTMVPFVTPAGSDTPATAQPSPAAPTAYPTAYPTAASSSVPTGTPAQSDPPATGIPVPTVPPTQPPAGQLDYSIFNNCCFVGNSVFEGLHNYGVIKNGTWYTKVGLNILTVYETPVIGGTVPIIDELNNGSYTGILLMFGQNECGWPDLNNFIRRYEQLLQDVWAKQPQAKLFLMGITPVSQQVSNEGKNGVTNANINTINTGLQALAERTQNAFYVSVPSGFYTSSGALQPDASNDGVHLNKAYMEVWADHICRVVSGVL